MSLFGTEAGLLVDLFLLALLIILPAMVVAVLLVRKGKVKAHATIMTACFALFLLAVGAFEIYVHFVADSPPLATAPLAIHLCFAVPCLVLWILQMAWAKRALTEPAAHRTRGKILMGLLTATVATGIWLYLATFT